MTTYTIQIEAGDVDGTIWQAVEPSETVDANESATELVGWVASNQNVANGYRWRVRAWEGSGTEGEPAAVLEGGPLVAVELAGIERLAGKRAYDEATDRLREAVLNALDLDCPETVVARIGHVDRMTVRAWAGK